MSVTAPTGFVAGGTPAGIKASGAGVTVSITNNNSTIVNNGIGIDILTDDTKDSVSCGYYAKLRCCGRVMAGFGGS